MQEVVYRSSTSFFNSAARAGLYHLQFPGIPFAQKSNILCNNRESHSALLSIILCNSWEFPLAKNRQVWKKFNQTAKRITDELRDQDEACSGYKI